MTPDTSRPVVPAISDPSATEGGPSGGVVLSVHGLTVYSTHRTLLRNVGLHVPGNRALVIIGASGAGKSTLLRCLNRMIDLTPNLHVEGDVLFRGQSIRAPGTDVDALRAHIGMLFQQPVVFPQSIYQNVLFGVRHLGRVRKADWAGAAERALSEAALWNEVKDRLHEPALRLSVGQQQRLCLARTLAVDPEVILLDEPTSALDRESAELIEDRLIELKRERALVVVTHDLRQARKLGDHVVCLHLVEGAGMVVKARGGAGTD